MDFRLMTLSSHYRSNLNFAWKALAQSKTNFDKISRFQSRIEKYQASQESKSSIDPNDYWNKFNQAMNDDINSPQALAYLFEMISETNKEMDKKWLNTANQKLVKINLEKIKMVLGLKIDDENKNQIPKNITALAEERVLAKKEKDFVKADALRKKIEMQGYKVEDVTDGYEINKV